MAVSGCSEEYRLWHPLVVLHTPCLIKHTSNTLSGFLLQRVGKRTCARLLLNARGWVFAEESVIDVLFI